MPTQDRRGDFWVMVVDTWGRRCVESEHATFDRALDAALAGRASDDQPRWVVVVMGGQ